MLSKDTEGGIKVVRDVFAVYAAEASQIYH